MLRVRFLNLLREMYRLDESGDRPFSYTHVYTHVRESQGLNDAAAQHVSELLF